MNVLIVDDDPDVRRTLKEFLESEGYHVRCAATGFDGMAHMATMKPDVVLLDIGLPDIEGHFVAARASSHWDLFDVPIIMLSGRSDNESISLARVLGARDYVVKPFDPNDLLDRIRSVLGTPLER